MGPTLVRFLLCLVFNLCFSLWSDVCDLARSSKPPKFVNLGQAHLICFGAWTGSKGAQHPLLEIASSKYMVSISEPRLVACDHMSTVDLRIMHAIVTYCNNLFFWAPDRTQVDTKHNKIYQNLQIYIYKTTYTHHK